MGRPSQLTTETLTRLAYGDGTEIEMLIFCESIEGPEARFTNLVEMECHVAHHDHYIAGQSCGAEPDEHRRADQRSHNNKSPHRQKDNESDCFACHAWPLELASATGGAGAGGGCGCGCSRAISRVFFLLPCIVERSSQEQQPVSVGFREGEARFTRNNGVRGIQGNASDGDV